MTDPRTVLSRRKLLHAGGGLVVATLASCHRDARACGPIDRAVQACAETHANIEGPYYRSGAPSRWDLTEPGMRGVPLDIQGRVTTSDCKTPLRDAELDVWQADEAGHYDNDGSISVAGMLLRGRVRTDGDGRYRVRSVVPGHYLNGARYRPAHVHVKLRAASHAPLTTQLYFPDDPHNAGDPFIHSSLVMDVTRRGSGMLARFDFALRHVTVTPR